jgi:RNA polymerase sigma factor (sigma-70 family)
MHHRERVQREKALSWLISTGLHEALKLAARGDRDVSLEAELEQGAQFAARRADRTPEALIEHRERLQMLAALPPPQRRVLWLYGAGFSYEEIARSEACTLRAVERRLHNARSALKERDCER